LHDEIAQAIEEHGRGMRRVEFTGEIVTDADGRPSEMTATDMTVIPHDEDLPPLASVAGAVPGLTDGLGATEFIHRRRREVGLVQ
jgi:hypothetical protein